MEKKEDIIYDLQSEETALNPEQSDSLDNSDGSDGSDSAEPSDSTEPSEGSNNSEYSDTSDGSDASDSSNRSEHSDNSERAVDSECVESPDNSVNPDPAREELDRMVEKLGAETLLEILKDNRNAAIKQIISEVESSRMLNVPAGNSGSKRCTSIFDLAAFA